MPRNTEICGISGVVFWARLQINYKLSNSPVKVSTTIFNSAEVSCDDYMLSECKFQQRVCPSFLVERRQLRRRIPRLLLRHIFHELNIPGFVVFFLICRTDQIFQLFTPCLDRPDGNLLVTYNESPMRRGENPRAGAVVFGGDLELEHRA